MTVLQNNRMRAFVMCALQQHLQRAEHNALQLHQTWSFRKRDGMWSRNTFTCSQNDQVPLYVQACKCQHDTKALCKMYKWQVAYHVKTKAVPGLCFRTWYAKKLKTKKRIKKRVWVCIFTRDFLSLCTHNTNTYGHAQWFTIISGASSMKRSATVQERRQGVVLRSVNIASVYSSQLIWWTLITLLC